MGFLLMQYEYQRANRKVSLHQRTGIRLDNQLERVTKRISKMESVFAKSITRIEHKWQQASNNFSSIISSAANSPDNLASALGSIIIGGVPLSNYVQIPPATGTDPQAILQAVTTAAAQAKAAMATLIQQAQEAETELVEAKNEEQLLPISEKEGDLQAEHATNESLLTVWTERRDAAKQKLGESIEHSVAHFGIK